MVSVTPVNALLREAMVQAMVPGADFRAAAAVLEDASAAITSAASIPAAANQITALAAAQPEMSPLSRILVDLRNNWTEAALTAWSEQLAATISEAPATAYATWHTALADAVAEFRFDLAVRIATVPVPSEGDGPAPEMLANWAKCADSERWREARPLLEHLANQATRNLARARVLTILAEIDAVVRADHDSARVACEMAAQLAPGDWRCTFVRGRIAAETNDIQEAERCFQLAAEAAPTIATIRAEWARLRARLGDVDGAQMILARAADCHHHPTETIAAELELYQYPDLFAAGAERIAALVERTRLLADLPEHANAAMVRAAKAFEANRELDMAHRWYCRAEELAPQWIGPSLGHGYLFLTENRLDEARARFMHVLRLAPEAVDGHWALANLAAETCEWDLLLSSARRTLTLAPEWRDAVASLLRGAAETMLGNSDDVAAARSFYDEVRGTLGAEYEGRYRNLLGHLAYRDGDFAAAAEEYRRAIAAAESRPDARFHGNLALALEQVHNIGGSGDDVLAEAIAETRHAMEIDPNEADYHTYLWRLETRQSYIARYGRAATGLLPEASRLRLRIDRSLVGALVEAEAEGIGRLNATFTRRMESFRRKIVETCLFNLCFVELRDNGTDRTEPGFWALEVGGAEVEAGHAVVSATGDELMDIFEAAILRQLPLFVGHAEAHQIAGKLSVEATTPQALGMLARAAREILSRDGGISLSEHSAKLREALDVVAAARFAGRAEDDIERIVIATAPDGPDPEAVFEALQGAVHTATGVVLPRIARRTDTSVAPAGWSIETEPPVLRPAPSPGLPPEEQIEAALIAAADRMLGAVALRWQLERVRAAEPDLVTAVQAEMDDAALLERLRDLLRRGHSILNLRHALEHLVLGSPPPAKIRASHTSFENGYIPVRADQAAEAAPSRDMAGWSA
ncbi:MAG: hypothetical protein ACRC67_05525 [Inquilinus sp.]|uniref:tetratricopeptide repeat protein n=1 Tax=Inquilinus sp. TaxID=1932117 RepID=UPI003F3A9CB1